MMANFGITWDGFEAPVDVDHHFVGKWVAWVVVVLHVAAALFHHLVRKDQVLVRMLPGFARRDRAYQGCTNNDE